MQDKFKELQDVVLYAVEYNLNVDVKSVKVTPFSDENGGEQLKVELILKLTPKKLPRDIMYELVKSASRAIRSTGEGRFPVILPHLAEKQLLAAQS